MTSKVDSNMLKLLNASGYLFQLAVEDVAKNSSKIEVVMRELPWRNSETGSGGFIDLLFSYGIVRIVVECKRPKDGTWLFLVNKDAIEVVRTKCCWVESQPGKTDLSGWDDIAIIPGSLESEICIIRGQGEENSPLLERLSNILLESVDALAAEEQSLINQQRFGGPLLYVPMIVTAADLMMCKVDPNQIELKDGTIKLADFESVPMIRFRKSLTTTPTPGSSPESLAASYKNKERTILIVNASSLNIVLSEWEIKNFVHQPNFPWNRARTRET